MEVHGQADRPEGLQIQASRLTMTNVRIDPKTSRDHLSKMLDSLSKAALFRAGKPEFPNSGQDLVCLPSCFRQHVQKNDGAYFDKSVESVLTGKGVPEDRERTTNETLNPLKRSESTTGLTYFTLTSDSFKLDAARDVWCLAVDQFWLEFVGVPSSRSRPIPFVDSFPITIWLTRPDLSEQKSSKSPSGDTTRAVCNSLSTTSDLSQSSASSGDVFTSGASDGFPDPTDSATQSERSKHLKMLRDYYSVEKDDNTLNGPTDGELDESIPDTVETAKLTSLNAADLHLIAFIDAKICVQLNHYQMLFLMRLIDTVTQYAEEIEDDTIFITKQPIPEQKMVLAVVAKEIELALVCPPIPELPGLHDDEPEQEAERADESMMSECHGQGVHNGQDGRCDIIQILQHNPLISITSEFGHQVIILQYIKKGQSYVGRGFMYENSCDSSQDS